MLSVVFDCEASSQSAFFPYSGDVQIVLDKPWGFRRRFPRLYKNTSIKFK